MADGGSQDLSLYRRKWRDNNETLTRQYGRGSAVGHLDSGTNIVVLATADRPTNLNIIPALMAGS